MTILDHKDDGLFMTQGREFTIDICDVTLVSFRANSPIIAPIISHTAEYVTDFTVFRMEQLEQPLCIQS